MARSLRLRACHLFGVTDGDEVAQRSIEILIGRLVTDEVFLAGFRTNAVAALIEFTESGYELTALEIAALQATPVEVWERAAGHIDPRLQKASLSRGADERGIR